MKPSLKRVSSIALSAVFILGSLFVFSIALKPAYTDILSKRAEIQARVKLAGEYESSLQITQKLLNEYQDIGRFQEMISAILPASQDLSHVLGQLTSLAGVNHLEIEVLGIERQAIRPPQGDGLAKGMGVLRMNFRLRGEYENFRALLRNLETNVNLMDVAELKIEPAARAKTGPALYNYIMSVDTYYQSE